MPAVIEKAIVTLADGTAVVPGTITGAIEISGPGDAKAIEPGVFVPRASGGIVDPPFGTGNVRSWALLTFDDSAATNDRLQIAVGPTHPLIRRRQSGTWGDWSRWAELDIGAITGTLTSATIAGDDRFLAADHSDGSTTKTITFDELYAAIRGQVTSRTAANQRAELHAQVIERQRNDDDIDITSGQVADTPGHTVERYGYARAAGPTGYLAGGSIAAAGGGDAADTIADALVAAWSHNSVSTFRFDADTPLLDRVQIGSTTYALTQSASDASTANWGNGAFDEYQVASTESDRDPLNFGSTSSTVEDVQFLRPDGSPFAFTLEDLHRSLQLDDAAEWTGVAGTDHAVSGLLNEMRMVADFADDLDTVDIQIFSHHPTVSVPSSGRVRRTIQLADDLGTLLFRQGDTRIFRSDAEDGQDYSAGTDFTRELESVYFRNADVPTDTDSSLVMVELGRSGTANTQTRFIYDLRARRMTSGAPDNAAWSPDTGSVLRASWLPAGNTGYVRDTNFVAPTGNNARAADSYRLFGSESELTELRNRLVAWNARADGSSARLVFRDLDGLPQSVSIRAWSAVSTDNVNRLWRYLDLTFAGNSTVFKPPAHATPVVVTVPQERAAAERADFLEEIGEFDSPSTGNWVSSAVARGDGELFGLSIDDDDIHLFREADITALATVTLGENAFRATTGKTWMRGATAGASDYIGRTADGRYAIGPSGVHNYRFFKVSDETGFSLTEEHRDTTGIELTEAGNTVGSSIDIPDSDLIAIQFDHPRTVNGQGDYRVFLFRREDLLDRLAETADTSQTAARLISFPMTGGEISVGHSGSTGRFIFAARSLEGAPTTMTIYPVVYSVTRADGFGLGSAVSRNITSTATTDIRIPATRFFAISPGSLDSNARHYQDRTLRFFRRAEFVTYNSPSIPNTATWLGFRTANQTLIGLANRNSNLWVNLGTASRLHPMRVYPVNARSDPQAQSAAPTGAYLEVQPPLTFTQSVAGANSQVIRETGEAATSIIWPDGIDHLKVTITPSSDFTGWGRLEYRQPGTNRWHYLEGRDTGHSILVTAGNEYSYRFPAASFRSTPTNEVSQLKLRVVRANEDNTPNTGNLTGSLDVEVDYESVEDAHDIVWTTILDSSNTVDIAPQTLSANLSGLTWHDENFDERIEIAKLQLISIHFLPTTSGTGTLALKLDRADIDYMGLNPGPPSGESFVMSVAWLQGYADRASPPTFRIPANWVNNIGAAGTPNWIVGLKSDGVYSTGLRFAAFHTTHGLRRIAIQHLR